MPAKPKSPLDKAKGHEIIWPSVAPVFDWARAMDDPCFVYFIGEEAGGPVKIGLAKDPVARLRTMQTGNPRRLKVEAVIVGDRRIERLFHELWEGFAIYATGREDRKGSAPGTEWFKPEIREKCFPIVATAVKRFFEEMEKHREKDFSPFVLSETAVRHAHIEHDFVAAGRDHTYLLGATGGYKVSRPSVVALT